MASTDNSGEPNALIASAQQIKVGKDHTKIAGQSGGGWQDAAWHFYDTVGEFAYAANWVGNLISRARLFATRDDGTGPIELPEEDPASQLVNRLFGTTQGRSQALQQIGVHYTVAGEAYVVGSPQGNDVDDWTIAAPSRLKNVGKKAKLDGKELPNNSFVMRIWNPHPIRPGQATSPARAALPILSEIERLTMHVSAQVDSRLASAGILFVPNELAFEAMTIQTQEGPVTLGKADTFVRKIQDAAARAIANRDDPASLVPMVVTGDGQYLENIQYMTFWTELDNHAIELRTEAIRRLALSMDMPPEVLTGQTEGNNRWNVWSIDESAIKSHSEPLLNRIAADLSTGYLRPMLTSEEGVPAGDVVTYGIGVDTSEMRLRPNRSREAVELWDRGELSSHVLLSETGFHPETDAPTQDERVEWFRQKVASGQTTPELVEAALKALGVSLNAQTSSESHESRPDRSLQEHPDRDMPEAPSAVDQRLSAACEVLVFRALERVGGRLRNKTNSKIPGVAAADYYRYVPMKTGTIDAALEGGWSAVPVFAPQYGVDSGKLTECLDAYVRFLMSEQKPHDKATMEQFIQLVDADK